MFKLLANNYGCILSHLVVPLLIVWCNLPYICNRRLLLASSIEQQQPYPAAASSNCACMARRRCDDDHCTHDQCIIYTPPLVGKIPIILHTQLKAAADAIIRKMT